MRFARILVVALFAGWASAAVAEEEASLQDRVSEAMYELQRQAGGAEELLNTYPSARSDVAIDPKDKKSVAKWAKNDQRFAQIKARILAIRDGRRMAWRQNCEKITAKVIKAQQGGQTVGKSDLARATSCTKEFEKMAEDLATTMEQAEAFVADFRALKAEESQ